MRQTLFSYLLWANPKSSANSEEQIFFDQHASLFNEATLVFNDPSSLFGVIRADIVLEGLLSKVTLDTFLQTYTPEQLTKDFVNRNAHDRLPYMTFQNQRIYIPTYPVEINRRYGEDMASLLQDPYKEILFDSKAFVIDPFLTYGNSLFQSSFSRIVKLDMGSSGSDCFYHPEFKTVFVIDKQGCLLEEIPLFDEKLKPTSQKDLFPRLNLLMKDYYANRPDLFRDHLLAYGFISKNLYNELVALEKDNVRLRARRSH
ncbi:MAG: hypothetical protein LKM30_08635 [Bacilli bacterium]|jgi:hypothetical protein|nr:hypothetical protein [Bacilli bacterium]